MAKRRPMRRGESKKVFNRGNKINGRNNAPQPMRGGIRL